MSVLDQWGNPVSSRTFLKAAQNGGGRMPSTQLRPMEPLRKLITQRDWQTVSYLSDHLYANNGIVEGAICQKSMYAIGNAWLPVFQGEAKDWGQEIERWLREEWYPTSDVRGMNYDFVTNLYQGSVAIDRSGDCIEALIQSENGWPQIQMIPSRQVGGWGNGGSDEKVSGGRYDGAYIRNGVIIDRAGRPLAYRHLGENRGEFDDIPADDIVHTFEPKWIDQARGFPLFTSVLEDWAMSHQSEEWEQQAMLIASAIGVNVYNEEGTAPEQENDPLGITAQGSDPGDIKIKTMLGGLIRYMKANSGEKIEQFISGKPGQEWEAYQDRIVRKALAAANWSYSMVWKPDGTNGTVQRSELNKCKISVTDRQSLIGPRARRKVAWAVSVAIKNGIIPPYPGKDRGGFMKWAFTLPERISIDEGRDRAQRRADNAAGLILDSTIVEQDGNTTYEEHALKRARDYATLELARRQVEAETGVDIPFRAMKMFTPNDQEDGQEPDNQNSDQDNENGGGNPEMESLKIEMDAYGVAVRAGAITPNDQDEARFRERMGLPAMNSNVSRAWREDKGVRRPITLAQEGATQADTQPKKNEDEE